jgi:hypothetical protein
LEKDSAKLRISQIIKSYFRATHIENSDYQGEIAASDVNNIVDKIEPDHHKVKLPLEVGEEFDLVATLYQDVLQFAYHLYSLSATEFPELVNCLCSDEGRWAIIDAYRYGWEAEPEAKWYVQTPKEWWEDKSEPEYVDLDSMGISDGLKCKEYAAQFTRDELKKYRLDNDIFTLVPVGEEK